MFLPVKSMKTPNYIVVYIFYYKENVQLFGFKKSTFCCRTQYARQNMYWCRNKLPITCTDMSNQASNIQKTMRGNRAHVGLVLFHTMLQQQGHQNYSKGNNKNKKRYVRLSSLMRRIIHIVIFFVNLPNNWSKFCLVPFSLIVFYVKCCRATQHFFSTNIIWATYIHDILILNTHKIIVFITRPLQQLYLLILHLRCIS